GGDAVDVAPELDHDAGAATLDHAVHQLDLRVRVVLDREPGGEQELARTQPPGRLRRLHHANPLDLAVQAPPAAHQHGLLDAAERPRPAHRGRGDLARATARVT